MKPIPDCQKIWNGCVLFCGLHVAGTKDTRTRAKHTSLLSPQCVCGWMPKGGREYIRAPRLSVCVRVRVRVLVRAYVCVCQLT